MSKKKFQTIKNMTIMKTMMQNPLPTKRVHNPTVVYALTAVWLRELRWIKAHSLKKTKKEEAATY
jgi:hypothetical protein